MSKNTGGPAFPTTHEERAEFDGHNGGRQTVVDPGMTLRDYFAAKAMQGFITGIVSLGVDTETEDATTLGVASYKIADAMLKARES